MTDILVTSPFRPFTLPTQFKAVFNGYIYCGTVDAVDPSVSQVQVYLVNESGDKVPVAQPLRTNAGGFLVYNGQPAKFVTDSNHSLLVQDSLHSQVWYEPDVSSIDPDSAFDNIYSIMSDNDFSLWDYALSNIGYVLIGTFEDGCSVTAPNQAVLSLTTGKAYRRTAGDNFTVPPASTPASGWVIVGATPEAFGAVGDGVANDLSAVKDAFATGMVMCNPRATYNCVVTTEADTIQPTARCVLLNRGAKFVHSASSFLLFLLKNTVFTSDKMELVFTGSYPANTGAANKYGLSYSSDAGFCGFIGVTGTTLYDIEKIKAYGQTDSNLYDTVIRGFTGSFIGSKINSIDCSHYANAVSDGMQRVRINDVRGTKRHNKSIDHYGPSHLVYASLIGSKFGDIVEYGEPIRIPSSPTDASVQITATNNETVVNSITTTMTNSGALAIKNNADGGTIENVTSGAAWDIDTPARLVEIQTNLQASVKGMKLKNVDVKLPSGNPSCYGFWGGGSNITADVRVSVPVEARSVEAVMIVTTDDSSYDIRYDSLNPDARIFTAGANRCNVNIDVVREAPVLTSDVSILGGSWGPSVDCVFDVKQVNGLNKLPTISVTDNTRNRSVFRLENSHQATTALRQLNKSVTTTLSRQFKLDVLGSTSDDHNIIAYEIDVMCSTITAANSVVTRYLVVKRNAQALVATIIATNTQGSAPPTLAVTESGGDCVITATRGVGSENLRDLMVFTKKLNSIVHS